MPLPQAENRVLQGRDLPDDLRTTLVAMQALIAAGSKNPQIVEFSRLLVGDLPDRRTVTPEQQEIAQIQRVWQWVCANIRYVTDAYDFKNNVEGEQLQDANATLELMAGDCDDMAVLSGAMIASLGIGVELWMAGGPQSMPPEGWSEMNAVADACESAGVSLPPEVGAYLASKTAADWTNYSPSPQHIFIVASTRFGQGPRIVVDCTLHESHQFGSWTIGPGWEYWPASHFLKG